MATVAGVEVWRRDKLAHVLVSMTISATFELDLEQRFLPFRDMTLRALDCRMLSLQRVSAHRMFLHSECRRLPSLNRMTGGALTAVWTLRKLPIVGIGLMTIHASCEDERLFEVPAGMTLSAVYARVPALKGELSLGVIEVLVDCLQ